MLVGREFECDCIVVVVGTAGFWLVGTGDGFFDGFFELDVVLLH